MMNSTNDKSLSDILMSHAEHTPTRTAFTFLVDTCQVKETISFFELDMTARKISLFLTANGFNRQPLMLLLDNPVHFACAFLGCIYAGVTAVPAPVPQFGKSWSRLDSIAYDAGIEVIITDRQVFQSVREKESFKQSSVSACRWLTLQECDCVDETLWRRSDKSNGKPAFLQYTSGSTGKPKGVMVSEQNILANVSAIATYFGASANSVHVSWLPLFHDMGLVGHIIHPVFIGCHSVIMKPLDFIKRPVRWLKAISDYQGTLSGAPNFAYELCLSRIKEHESTELDLSSWCSAYIGAEPVRLKTLDKFYQRFKSAGFQKKSLLPLYGLSESTLMVSGVEPNVGIATHKPMNSSKKSLSSSNLNIQNELVSCGIPIGDQKVTIVEPVSCTVLPEGKIGEVWLTGSNLAMGYWRNEKETNRVFKAQLKGKTSKQYFRTGDLGFIREGELYITGRIKDVLIIKGENFAATDLELTAEQSHPDIINGGSAAFSVFVDGEEKAVLICEIEKGLCLAGKDVIVAMVCDSFSSEFGFLPFDVVFVKPHALPRTTSGKIMRQNVRADYLDGFWTQDEKTSYYSLAKNRKYHQITGEICG